MLRRLRDEALVLERRDLGESDRLVVLLGASLGKFSAVAPSGRSSRRRFGGCLELFSRIDVQAVDRGRGGLWRLEEASLIEAHAGIRTDLISIAHAGYVCELAAAMLREGDDGRQTFGLLARWLARLNGGRLSSIELRVVELEILGQAGFAPHLGGCISCQRRDADDWAFDFDQGGILCPSCGSGPRSLTLSAGQLGLLRALQSGQVPEKIQTSDIKVLRMLLARVIDVHVGRPLRARDFLHRMAAAQSD
jgi:DNA repair protein RecO (recombination protein O)